MIFGKVVSMRFFLLPLALLFVFILVLSGCKNEAPPATGGVATQIAPDFTLRALSGESVSLSQYRGKVVFLNFWATWCPPCRAELPSMQRLNEVFAGRDFVMLAVNVEEDGAKVLPEFLRQFPHSYQILLDDGGQAQKLYGVDKFPETFVIDKQGRVVERIIGARDWSAPAMLQRFKTLVDAP
jgi:peroxiredoxin